MHFRRDLGCDGIGLGRREANLAHRIPQPVALDNVAVIIDGQALGFKLVSLYGEIRACHSTLGFGRAKEHAGITCACATKASVETSVLVRVIEHQPARAGASLADQFTIFRSPLRLSQGVPSSQRRALELCVGNKTRTVELGRNLRKTGPSQEGPD